MHESRSTTVAWSMGLAALFAVCGTVLGSVYLMSQGRSDRPLAMTRAAVPVAPTPSLATAEASNPVPEGDATVDATRTGRRYHRDGCSALARSRVPMTVNAARAAGLTPCLLCFGPAEAAPPPASGDATPALSPGDQTGASATAASALAGTAAGDTVYATRTGRRYHRAGCSALARSQIPMRAEDARASGLTPCRLCFGDNRTLGAD